MNVDVVLHFGNQSPWSNANEKGIDSLVAWLMPLWSTYLFARFNLYLNLYSDLYSDGFTLKRRRSRRHPAEVLADLDYADDIALSRLKTSFFESKKHAR